MSTRRIRVVVSSVPLASKELGATYVCGHFGTILGLDTPCAKLCWLGFMDDTQGQAWNSIGFNNVLHESDDIGCEDSARFSTENRLLWYGRIYRAINMNHRKDGEEETESHGAD